MSTPFELHRGTLQQRVATANAAGGTHVYEMGHAGHLEVNLEAGDRHDVSQSIDFVAQAALLRSVIRISAPPEVPEDMRWELQVLLNGTQHYRRRVDVAGRLVTLFDVVVRLESEVPEDNEITFRLVLVAA